MTYFIPSTLLKVRFVEEEILYMVLVVEVPAYEPHHITDKLWPSLATKVRGNAILALDELIRNILPWKTILTASLTDDDLRAQILLLISSRFVVFMTLTVLNRPMAILVVLCTRPAAAAFHQLVPSLRGSVSLYVS